MADLTTKSNYGGRDSLNSTIVNTYLVGVESCQCRKARIQRNHINCAKKSVVATQTIGLLYRSRLFTNLSTDYSLAYLIQQLKCPALSMTLGRVFKLTIGEFVS